MQRHKLLYDRIQKVPSIPAKVVFFEIWKKRSRVKGIVEMCIPSRYGDVGRLSDMFLCDGVAIYDYNGKMATDGVV